MIQNIDVFKPVRTKGGHKVKITAVDFQSGEDWPIRADVVVGDGKTEELSYTSRGLYDFSPRPSCYDLENFVEPEMRTFWVNVYKNSYDDSFTFCSHTLEDEAVTGVSVSRRIFARVKVVVKEGEGLG